MIYSKKSLILFLFPSLAGFTLFFLIPFIGGVYYTAVNNAFERQFVGFSNYIRMFSSEMFQLAFKNTFIFIGICVPLIMMISFSLAILLKKTVYHMNFFRSGFVLPIVIPSVSVILIWNLIFDYNGYVNYLVTALGFEPVIWMEGYNIRFVIIALYIWHNCGYNMIIFLSGFNTIPVNLYESAVMEGASKWMILKKITIPLLFPTIFFVLIISVINGFKVFKEAYLLAGMYPPPTVYLVQHYMYNQLNKLDYSCLTTAAYVFAFFVYILVAMIYTKEKRVSYI